MLNRAPDSLEYDCSDAPCSRLPPDAPGAVRLEVAENDTALDASEADRLEAAFANLVR